MLYILSGPFISLFLYYVSANSSVSILFVFDAILPLSLVQHSLFFTLILSTLFPNVNLIRHNSHSSLTVFLFFTLEWRIIPMCTCGISTLRTVVSRNCFFRNNSRKHTSLSGFARNVSTWKRRGLIPSPVFLGRNCAFSSFFCSTIFLPFFLVRFLHKTTYCSSMLFAGRVKTKYLNVSQWQRKMRDNKS